MNYECSKCRLLKHSNEYYKNYYSWCKECHRLSGKEKYHKKKAENPILLKQKAKEWRDNNRERYRKNSIRYQRKRRIIILKKYSGDNVECACCLENEVKFLSVDHINGGGLKHIRDGKIGRGNLYQWLVKNNFPRGFQILCHNCNFAKGHYEECPHKTIIN